MLGLLFFLDSFQPVTFCRNMAESPLLKYTWMCVGRSWLQAESNNIGHLVATVNRMAICVAAGKEAKYVLHYYTLFPCIFLILCSNRALEYSSTCWDTLCPPVLQEVQCPLESKKCQLAFSKQSFSWGHIMAQTFTVLKGPKPFFSLFFLFYCLHPRPKFALCCPAFEASSFLVDTIISTTLFGQTFQTSSLKRHFGRKAKATTKKKKKKHRS